MFLKRLLGNRAGDTTPAETQDLFEAALTSPEARIRRDACRRLMDLAALRSLAADDGDAGVRELASARYRRLLCGGDEAGPPMCDRLGEVAAVDDPVLLHAVAVQGQEPELRLAAIGRLTAPSALAACALDDPLAANRLAAAERVQDKAALEQIVKGIGKRDKRVYRLARERLKAIADAEQGARRAREQAEALCAKVERLGRFDNWVRDRGVLDHTDEQWAAIDAELDPELRERYQALRQAFLAAYEDHARAHAAELAAQQAHADACRQREALLAELEQGAELDDVQTADQQIERIIAAWEGAATADPADAPGLERRFEAALAAARAQRSRLVDRNRAVDAAERLRTDADRLQVQGGAPERKALRALQRRFDELPADLPQRESLAPLLDTLTRRFDKHRRQFERKLAALPGRLEELDAHFERGELKKAEPLYQSIMATLDQARSAGLPQSELAPVAAHLKSIAPRLNELRQWRRWSADEHREGLCRDVEALAEDEGRNEEQAAHRLQELQRDWRELDRHGAPAADALWQRFHRAAEHVHERCKPFLEQQAALRAENRRQREVLCKRLEDFLEQVDWARVDWKKLARAEREMRQSWAALGPIEARHYKPLEGRFRRSLRRLDKVLSEERDRNQAEKRTLIEQMQALADEPDLRRAIDAAKGLQQQWHTTVAGRQRDENALWKAFRSASDAVFARRQAEQEARGSELRDNQAAREAICHELRALTAAASLDAARFEEQLRALKTRWHDTESLPVPRQAASGLAKHWRAALAEAHAQLDRLREAARWDANARMAHRAQWLDTTARRVAAGPQQLAAEELEAGWAALPALDADAQATLEDAFALVRAAVDDPAAREVLLRRLGANRERREEICLLLEIIAGVPSPPALRDERMALQVDRLRGRMGEGEADPLADAGALLRDWHLATPAAAAGALDARFERACEALKAGAADTVPA